MKRRGKWLKTMLVTAGVFSMAVLPPAQALAAGTGETLLESEALTESSAENGISEESEKETTTEESSQETTASETEESSSEVREEETKAPAETEPVETETAKETEAVKETEKETVKESETETVKETEKETVGETAKETEEGTDTETVENYEAETQPEEDQAVIKYRTHVQTFGWLDWSDGGKRNGTEGKSKRLEGIEIKIENTKLEGDIEYQTHVQGIGWMDWVKNGAMSGTERQSKRLEAIRIRLQGELAEAYDVYYRVHVQSIGWLDWAKNGEEAGTSGLSRRLESIEIQLVKKGGEAPGSTARYFASRPGINYMTHMQTFGDQPWTVNGTESGVIGKSRRMEGFAIRITGNHQLSGSIEYRSHVQSYGWMDWVSDGAYCGTTRESKRMEALQLRLTGELGKACDIYYRVHAQSIGWMGWVKNGDKAGTEGLGLRIEAIQIVIGPKDTVPYEIGGGYMEYTGPGYYNLGGTKVYFSGRATRRGGTGWERIDGERYYLVNGKPVTGWQYIGAYKYYFYEDGRLCQNIDSIIGPQSSYQIRVNKLMNCVTVYAYDAGNGYIIPVKAMLCSTGDDTPLGTFRTPAKYRWQPMFNGTYVQFATRLTAGENFLFHSVTYEVNGNNRTLNTEGYNGLGVIRSAGCIRLVCGEAYWVYTRCPIGTTVIVYNDENAGPFDRPVVAPIPANQRWDPTDPFL
ncbi:MAG: L,D-transpeptidase family protein [Lachnospiraceae bacterium]|nr:L,D-transpeptidase family protein [Lachnospiraceae bacterium]